MNKITLSGFISDWLLKCNKRPKILNHLAKEQGIIEVINKVGDDKSSISWFISSFSKIKIRNYQAPNLIDYLDFHYVLKNLNSVDFIESDLTVNLIVCALDCSDKNGKSLFIKQKHPCSENELYYKKMKSENCYGEKSDLDNNFNYSTISALNMNKKTFQNYIRILSLCLSNQLFKSKVSNELLFTENIRRLANILNLNNEFVSSIKFTNSDISNMLPVKFKNQLFKPIMGKIIIESYVESVIARKIEIVEFLNEVIMNNLFLLNFGIIELIGLAVEKLDIKIDDVLVIFTDRHTIREIEMWLPVFRIIEKYLRVDKIISFDSNELSYLFSGMISESFHAQLDLDLHPISTVFFSSLLKIDIDWNKILIDEIEDKDFNREFFNFYIQLGRRFSCSNRLFNRLKTELDSV